MHPLFRLWGWSALLVAALLVLRGALLPALACFLLSPAPALLFAHGGGDLRRMSMSWLGALVGVVIALSLAFALVVHLGGIPPVHEWRSTLQGK